MFGDEGTKTGETNAEFLVGRGLSATVDGSVFFLPPFTNPYFTLD